MKVVEAKQVSRADIQKRMKAKLKELVAEFEAEGVNIDSPEFVRRFPRAAVHEAAKMTMDNGGGPHDFLYMFQAAWAKEQSEESLGEAVHVAPVQTGSPESN